jgi:hypothetical protein
MHLIQQSTVFLIYQSKMFSLVLKSFLECFFPCLVLILNEVSWVLLSWKCWSICCIISAYVLVYCCLVHASSSLIHPLLTQLVQYLYPAHTFVTVLNRPSSIYSSAFIPSDYRSLFFVGAFCQRSICVKCVTVMWHSKHNEIQLYVNEERLILFIAVIFFQGYQHHFWDKLKLPLLFCFPLCMCVCR